MNVTLSQELENIIRNRIASGRYHSPTEVMREALHLIEERDNYLENQKELLRRDLQAGLDQLDRGEAVVSTPDEVITSIKNRLKQER